MFGRQHGDEIGDAGIGQQFHRVLQKRASLQPHECLRTEAESFSCARRENDPDGARVGPLIDLDHPLQRVFRRFELDSEDCLRALELFHGRRVINDREEVAPQ